MKIIGLLQAGLSSIGLTWLDVLILVAGIALMVWMYLKGNPKTVKRLILELVLAAEKEYGSGTGKIKFETVLANAHKKLPVIVRIFITEARLKKWIQEMVDWMKETLTEKNANLLDVATEAVLPNSSVVNIKADFSGHPGKVGGESSGPAE